MRVLLAYFTDRALSEIPYIPIQKEMMIELVPSPDSCEENQLALSERAKKKKAGQAGVRDILVELVSRKTSAIARTCR